MTVAWKILIAVLAAVLVLVLVVFQGTWSLNRRLHDEVGTLFAQARGSGPPAVTEDMLAALPAPVRRYLTHTGIVGKPTPRTVRLRQSGRIRESAGRPWMAFTAEEYYTVNPPGFIWIAAVRTFGLPLVRVRDAYQDGHGKLLVKLGSLTTLADATGPELDQGALLRYLNEMTGFPAAFLGRNVTWRVIDDHSAAVTLTNGAQSVTATMYFDNEGNFVDFVARRYRTVGDRYELETWSTPITAYAEFQGLRLPAGGKGVWKLAGGDLAYIELTVTDEEFDIDRAY